MGVFVDSNVFLYGSALDDPKREVALRLLRALSESGTLVISSQVVGEVYMTLRRTANADAANSQIRGMLEACTLHPLGDRTTHVAMDISGRYGLDFWDSHVVAAAIASGSRYLFTEDLQDGQVIDGVTIVNPFREGFDVGAL